MNAPLFKWGAGEESSPSAGASPDPVDAGAQSAQGALGVAHLQGRASADAAKAAADSSPRKRGRPRADGSAGGGRERALQDQINSAIASQLDALHDPEAWGALLALPGDAIHAVTGRERWEVKKDERRTLGVTGSAFARTLMITNPRALAGMMLAAAIFATYGTRALAELKEYRERQGEPAKAADAPKTA